MNSLAIRHIWNQRIDIELADGSPLACYRFEETLPKPCFHPLCTPSGHQISGFQMSDHVWHRGLWFAIKFINQSNFWEERLPFGIQASVQQPACELQAADRARIAHKLRWISDATGPVIEEDRNLVFTAHADGIRGIDWSSSLVALADLTLDRTPFTTWGGYGGLSFRAARAVHGTTYLPPTGPTTNLLAGQTHPWMVIRGLVDGSPDAKISLGMIDHPTNPRSPSPWYCKAGQSYDFMNAAFLFHEPMNLAKGQRLDFRYRVLYRDGWWEADEFARLADSFRDSTT